MGKMRKDGQKEKRQLDKVPMAPPQEECISCLACLPPSTLGHVHFLRVISSLQRFALSPLIKP